MAFKRLYTHPLHATWAGMMARCYRPEAKGYRFYGARGIQVCDAWKDEAAFIQDILSALGPRPAGHTLDRINTDGHYEPGNVRWASSTRQAAGRRNSIQVMLDGEPLALRTACLKHLKLTRGQYNIIFREIRAELTFP